MNENFEYKKRFYDMDKEESWLNEMSEKGLLLKSVKWGVFKDTYTFDRCGKKYIFRLDYTKEDTIFEKSTSPYVMFVTSTYNAEYVCCLGGKVYFRKSEESGEFPPVYTDLESKLSAEKTKFGAFTSTAILFIMDISMLRPAVMSAINYRYTSDIIFSIIAGVLCLSLFIYCFIRACRHYKKIRDIKKIMKE